VGSSREPVQISYAEYLAEYAEYLNALQFFKHQHLALTRRKDPVEVKMLSVKGFPGVYFSKERFTSEINHTVEKSYEYNFTTNSVVANVHTQVLDEYGRPQPQTVKVPFDAAHTTETAPPPLAKASGDSSKPEDASAKAKARAARKRAANKRRKVRKALLKARTATKLASATTEQVKAELRAASLQKKKAAKSSTPPKRDDPGKKVVKKKESPSRRRRREKRLASRSGETGSRVEEV